MAPHDIVILADIHVGLREENHALRGHAAVKTIGLLKQIDPGTIILNGDFADLWVYYEYDEHRSRAIEQARPYAEYLKTSKARKIFIPGNCDELRSLADIDRLYEILEDPHRSIAFEFLRAFWDPDRRIFVTHGHALPRLMRRLIENKDRPDLFAVDFPVAAQAHQRSTLQTTLNRLASAASHTAKRLGLLQRLIQFLIIRRLQRLVQRLCISGLIAEPCWIVFSHTHRAGVHGNIINTGTAGPQGACDVATVLQIDAEGNCVLWKTFDPSDPACPMELASLKAGSTVLPALR